MEFCNEGLQRVSLCPSAQRTPCEKKLNQLMLKIIASRLVHLTEQLPNLKLTWVWRWKTHSACQAALERRYLIHDGRLHLSHSEPHVHGHKSMELFTVQGLVLHWNKKFLKVYSVTPALIFPHLEIYYLKLLGYGRNMCKYLHFPIQTYPNHLCGKNETTFISKCSQSHGLQKERF